WAIQRAKERKCQLIQLTTDKERPEALRFYKKLGFKNSHEGLKLYL
ncbi:GNAT family N-acetyltransferase, partial [Priestia endophytica]